MTFLRSALLLAALMSPACGYPEPSAALPSPSSAEFQESVYPVLLRDCGFAACHGTSERFFQVYGPGRERLSEETAPLDPVTAAELELSYGRARSMLKTGKHWRESQLLRKPLAEAAGGAGHRGADPWKQNLYASKQDPGYRALERWARAASSAVSEAP